MTRRSRTLRISIALSLVGAFGCSKANQSDTASHGSATVGSQKPPVSSPSSSASSNAVASAPRAPKGPFNVLLLSIDCLRADMPWTGYERPIAPNLTKLVESSAVYTHAYSTSSYTAQSVAAILSGRLASTLYRTGVFFTAYPKSNRFFPEALAENQIRSIGWFAHLYFGRGKGLDQGFSVWELVPGITFNPQTDEHVTSPKTVELGMRLLGDPANTSGRFFAWTHFGDPHDQYIKHPEGPDFGNKTRDKYDSEVWFTDHHLGRLLDWAKQQPWWANTAVIVTGDHGESFGEHGQYRHAFDIWENLVRVPLIVHIPGAQAQRITERRSHLDLAPTIMDLLGQAPLPEFVGKSLLPELLGQQKPDNREPIVLELTEDSNNPQRRGIVMGNYKYIVRGHGGNGFLYDLAADPGETRNIAKEQPEQLKEMKALYDKTFAQIPSIAPYGGNKLESGRLANGPVGPAKTP